MDTNTTATVIEKIVVTSENLDIFYNVSTWVVGILGLLFAVLLFYVILIVRDMTFVSRKAKETSEMVEEYVQKPLSMLGRIFASFESLLEMIGMGDENKK